MHICNYVQVLDCQIPITNSNKNSSLSLLPVSRRKVRKNMEIASCNLLLLLASAFLRVNSTDQIKELSIVTV